MNLSKRIALTSSIILVFFLFTIVVFMWSAKISREKVSQLQSVIRSQYQVVDISQQLKEQHASESIRCRGLGTR